MSKYTNSDDWADIVPIAQDDGGPNPLAAIAYTEEYSEAMSYLRAIMAQNEMSERALELTEHIIDMNPAHYTVWYFATLFYLLLKRYSADHLCCRLYRAKILFSLNSDLNEELKWLDQVSLRHLKNYQIWYTTPSSLSSIISLNRTLQAPPPNDPLSLPHSPHHRASLPNPYARQRRQKLPRLDVSPMACPAFLNLGCRDSLPRISHPKRCTE